MENIITYELVMVAKSKDEFEKKLNEKLAQGHQLYGSTSLVYHTYGRYFYYCQAITKEHSGNRDNNP